MSKVLLVVKTRTQPGQRDEVRARYESALAPRAEANAAQEIVLWASDLQDPDVFYLVEVYSDRAAMEANGQAPWFYDYLGQVGPMLAGPPETFLGTPEWAKGIGL